MLHHIVFLLFLFTTKGVLADKFGKGRVEIFQSTSYDKF